MATQIPPEIKKVVTFIFIKRADEALIPNGTGFFVGVRKQDNSDNWYVYLVTAKHVLTSKDGGYFPSIYIRLNTHAGDAEVIEFPLDSHKINIFTHHQNDVDIAVIPCLPSQERYDFKFIPQEMLVTREKFREANIREGDEVFFTGLFVSHIGQKRNYPIVRFGRVALLSEEPIDWQGKLLDLYLVESQSFGGNSGSPVFFYLGVDRTPGSIVLGQTKVLMAGIMMGSFLNPSEIRTMNTSATAISVENAGIAAVVPAYLLHDILFSEKLKSTRE